jgi:transposase
MVFWVYSAAQNAINPCEYMRALIDNEKAVIKTPSDWLPWCYKEALKPSSEVDAKKDAFDK